MVGVKGTTWVDRKLVIFLPASEMRIFNITSVERTVNRSKGGRLAG